MISPSPARDELAPRKLFRLSIGVFFLGGFVTSIVSLLVPRLKLELGLGYAQALLVQLAFHSSYLVFALPIAVGVVRLGYMRAIAVGLGVMVTGCLGFAAVTRAHDYLAVLAAILLLATGITVLQIAANTVVAVVGPSANAVTRLTLLQGFNSLGTVLGPLLTARYILAGTASGGADDAALAWPFAVSALALGLLSLAFTRNRDLLPGVTIAEPRTPAGLRHVLGNPRLRAGTAAMFAYVGAEVTIGALLTSYLMRSDILHAAPVAAGRLVSVYWGGAMVGRFVGAALMRWIAPARLLIGVACGATMLTLAAVFGRGPIGAGALLAVGLMNSVMYPTIFALALPDDAKAAPLASMWLCMAVVGGAVVPVLTGMVADASDLPLALGVPAICYVGIAAFGRFVAPHAA